ncbi:MAG: DUF1549 domain-containing protein [Planctomycetaceae bacterium]|nr:DUF1549 domain-containing protein [Planctomycetaceae bacterium]
MIGTRLFWMISVVALGGSFAPIVVSADEKLVPVQQVTAKIDGFLESHWSAHKIQPAKPADDAMFLRRVTLDLTGRIPTIRELDEFLANKARDKRRKLIEQLIDGPEFSLHLGNVLDGMIQGRYAGNAEFVDYLRRSIRDSKPWDVVFREMMLGPWDTEPSKPANRFLDKRAKTSDVLAIDTARTFFGVDISCAKCHDHPLVDDWKQEHFYGMVAFFNRTTGGKGKIGEKKEGEVTFLGANGKEKVAKVMFLSGQVLEDPTVATAESLGENAKPLSRREKLVQVALEQREFFSRSLVNRLWEYFYGRGLVDPVDQMHSGNPSAVPGLLEWLAKDFASSGYDLRRLITALVNTRAYQLSSRWEQETTPPAAYLFAAATLRPLSQRQLAFSLLLATGNGRFESPDPVQQRVERYAGVRGLKRIEQYLTLESQATELEKSFDERRPEFQSSVSEALFLSNNPAAQELIATKEQNLAGQLGTKEDPRELISQAVRTILSRVPSETELHQLSAWFEHQKADRPHAIENLIWALVTSAEFRFNH